ncbi:MAG: murein biosynthesis integral membrane protein MurJ [Candidatus Carbobacillus sp.]|nr:murein biosynthesis integral membrane protein MurJ [Candidatus Carbobacillus sp.]
MSKSYWIKITILTMMITVLSRVLGFFRETAIAAFFGASSQSDAFFVAYSLPGILFSTIASAIGTTFIPVYSRLSEEKKERFLNNITSIIGLMSLLLTIISICFAPYLVKIFAFGFDDNTYKLTVHLTIIMLITIIFLSLNAIFNAYLQSHSKFLIPSAIGIPYNSLAIIYLLLFGNFFGIEGFTWMIVISTVVQVLFQFPAIKKVGWNYRFVLDLRDPGIQQVLTLVGPVFLGSMAGQVNVLVDRMLASSLSEGSISALNYANKVMQLSMGIIVVSILSILYPRLSEAAGKNLLEEVNKYTKYAVKILFLILIPVTLGGIVLAYPIIQLLFERGAFSATDTEMTSGAFLYFNLGIVGLGLLTLFERVYFAFQETKVPVMNGLISLGINILLNFLLVGPMAHNGLALATSISLTVSSVLIIGPLTKKIGVIFDREVYLTFLKALVMSILMACFLYFSVNNSSVFVTTSPLWYRLLWLITLIFFGAVFYSLGLLFLRETTILEYINFIINKAKRNKKISSSKS